MESDDDDGADSLHYEQSIEGGSGSANSARESYASDTNRQRFQDDQPLLHVDYILVAEFSIDKGPTMEHQYPTPISGDEG